MDVIALSNGDTEIISSTKDFEELLDKHLGMEASKYFHDIVSEFIDRAEAYDKLSDENIGLNDAKIDLENRVSELEKEIEEKEATIEDLTYQLNDQKDEYKQLENEYEDYRLEHRYR